MLLFFSSHYYDINLGAHFGAKHIMNYIIERISENISEQRHLTRKYCTEGVHIPSKNAGCSCAE
jgi:hypothetical protein